MKNIITVSILMIAFSVCAQDASNAIRKQSEKMVGGSCEGCEAALEYGKKNLSWIDTLPDFSEDGPTLEVSGTIYQLDGKTPAKDVILYIYHTDQQGEYSLKEKEEGWGKRHGYIRGWIKTNSDGRYKFLTLKPAAYPGGGNPAHIHPIVKEPGIQPYWIDEYLFEGDPYLSDKVRKSQRGRGGSGIVKPQTDQNSILTVKRDIMLGSNVPGYEPFNK